jgi:hypothetical protein
MAAVMKMDCFAAVEEEEARAKNEWQMLLKGTGLERVMSNDRT